MIKERLFFLCSFFLFVGMGFSFAQTSNVRVQIEGIPFGKNRFSAVAFKDYISLTPEFLAQTNTVENKTSLDFSLENPRWIRITGMGISYDIMAIPGNTYQLKIKQEDGTRYFENQLATLTKDDPNKWRDSVDAVLGNYLYTYNTQLFNGSLAKKTSVFADSVEKSFAAMPDVLFQIYLGFRLDELRLLAKVWSETAMYKLRFEGKVFQPENPDYAYAFEEFYKGRLGQILLKSKMSYGKQLINDMRGADTVRKWIATEPYYQGEVGEGALLLGLTELLNNQSYSRDAVLLLFNQFTESSSYASVKNLSSALYNKYRLPVSGEQSPTLQVEDKTGKLVDVGTDANRRTYLCFFDPSSEVIGAELAAINELKKSLKENMVLVPVIINADKTMLNNLQKNNKLAFELYRNTQLSTLADFRLKSDCTCMVLAPDGKYVLPQAPIPSAPNASKTLVELAKISR